ncbi:unnamed protein product [Cutaneotrichosporon oleaginosum]
MPTAIHDLQDSDCQRRGHESHFQPQKHGDCHIQKVTGTGSVDVLRRSAAQPDPSVVGSGRASSFSQSTQSQRTDSAQLLDSVRHGDSGKVGDDGPQTPACEQ